ncbi:carboxypeptidase-like regulatory domain-containing protein [uncultured Paludibaculum sp.]|uniref:carboxypeptidase-like regulatory domain-containing protein n=1 Tax=uncultured Paludibaculum sp. TaxID=1765020 RepID=UPI002AABDE3F|nr:carboxypeptidase-like regulatory domain-containing protein [uncultured Paludibaculum sp.]
MSTVSSADERRPRGAERQNSIVCGAICRLGGLVLLAGSTAMAAFGPGCAISGRVTDQQGRPLESTPVVAVRTGALGFGQDVPSGGVTTDERGAFCLTGLRSGEYFLRVLPSGAAPSASPACKECCAAGSDFPRSYYYRVQKTGRRQAVRVEEGRTVSGVAVVIPRVPAYCVSGEALDRAGALRDDVALSLEGDGWSSSVMNEGGRFLLTNLVAGQYLLVIRQRGVSGSVLAREVIRVGRQNGRVVVRLQ